MMKRTILYFLAIAACASAASISTAQKKVALNDQAKEIVNSMKPLTQAKKIAKIIRIIASQGDKSRDFIVSLKDISTDAQKCVMTQAKALQPQVQAKTLSQKDLPQAIIDNCPDYKTELQTTWDAYQAAMPEMSGSSGEFFDDFPQSVKDFIKSYSELSQEIQNNPEITKDHQTFGPKVTALIKKFRDISEADRNAIVSKPKLGYAKEFLLPGGSHYQDLEDVLNYVDAKANGQNPDPSNIKAQAKNLQSYMADNSDKWFDYINDKIDAFKVKAKIAKDGAVNSVAASISKAAAAYAKMAFAAPQFNNIMNSMVSGDISAAPEAMDGQMSIAIQPPSA